MYGPERCFYKRASDIHGTLAQPSQQYANMAAAWDDADGQRLNFQAVEPQKRADLIVENNDPAYPKLVFPLRGEA